MPSSETIENLAIFALGMFFVAMLLMGYLLKERWQDKRRVSKRRRLAKETGADFPP